MSCRPLRRSGVRALPPRTRIGPVPLAAQLPSPPGRSWWVVAGLGARGLVYHAWLGRLLAAAALADDEALLPPELLSWRRPGAKHDFGGDV
jgi:glycine/D-amino acid oxidase-like deaminating enzyme